MEYMDAGTLLDIEAMGVVIPEPVIARVAEQVSLNHFSHFAWNYYVWVFFGSSIFFISNKLQGRK